jgi:hypothetical protein
MSWLIELLAMMEYDAWGCLGGDHGMLALAVLSD